MRLIIIGIGAILLLTNGTAACDSGWRYIGRSPWELMSAIEDPVNPNVVYIGTYWYFSDPETGGAYKHTDPDTTWEYAGLVGHRIWRLVSFPYCHPERIFAATTWGLYMYEADTTWTLITTTGIPQYEHTDFAISPYDTSVWLLTMVSDFGGRVRLSRDSGQSWHSYYQGSWNNNLMFSRTFENILYFTTHFAFIRANLADSTFENLGVFSDVEYLDAAYHTSQPWIYIVGITPAGYVLGRYDEITGDTLRASLPDGINSAATISYVESEGLLVGTSSGLRFVSDDLMNWQNLDDPLAPLIFRILFAGNRYCIGGTWEHVYAADREMSLSPNASSASLRYISTFPNPTTGTICIEVIGPGTIDIFDLLGRRVEHVGISSLSTSQTITLTNLTAGTYFYRFSPLRGFSAKQPMGRITVIK